MGLTPSTYDIDEKKVGYPFSVVLAVLRTIGFGSSFEKARPTLFSRNFRPAHWIATR
jgi:hypothetical protein